MTSAHSFCWLLNVDADVDVYCEHSLVLALTPYPPPCCLSSTHILRVLRTADAFPVVASLPPKIIAIFRRERRRPKMRLLFAGYSLRRPHDRNAENRLDKGGQWQPCTLHRPLGALYHGQMVPLSLACLPIPYPLPLSTPATQATLSHTNCSLEVCIPFDCYKYTGNFLDFFTATRSSVLVVLLGLVTDRSDSFSLACEQVLCLGEKINQRPVHRLVFPTLLWYTSTTEIFTLS